MHTRAKLVLEISGYVTGWLDPKFLRAGPALAENSSDPGRFPKKQVQGKLTPKYVERPIIGPARRLQTQRETITFESKITLEHFTLKTKKDALKL